MDLVYSGSVLKQLTFVYADGGRIIVVLPEIDLAEEHRYKLDHVDRRTFYWNRNSLGYKLMSVVGEFYIYQDAEGVAQVTGIEIRNS